MIPDANTALSPIITENDVTISSVLNNNIIKLNGLDKYDVYLSGAKALLEIETNSSSDKELIVFRDSFGSSLIPLLVSSYSKITVIDTRYISPKILDNYIDINNQDVLFIYNVSIINNSYSLK